MAVAETDGGANPDEFQTVVNEWSTITEQYNDAVTRHTDTNNPETPNNETV